MSRATRYCADNHHHGGQHHNAVEVHVLDGGSVTAVAGDRAVAAVATRQHGVVTHAQLVECGITPRAIERRVQAGRLHRLHRAVYAVGHTADAPLAAEAAALLACGEGAVLSHRSAGAAWGLVPRAPGEVEVTLAGRDCGVRPGVIARRTRRLARVDVRTHAGLRLTGPARTLLDLAASLSTRRLHHAVNEALVARLVSEEDLRAALDRGKGRRGAPRLRALLDEAGGPTLTRSEAERRLLDLLRASGLPAPETNVRLGGFEVDCLWRSERLVVEVDGFAFHGTRAAFERDRARDAKLQAAGFAVVRVTWRQIAEAPDATAALLARLILERTATVVA